MPSRRLLAVVLAAAALTGATATPAPAALVFADPRDNLWIAEDDGSAARQLAGSAAIGTPVLSRDGTKVVFRSQPGRAMNELMLVPTDGGPARTLASFGAARDFRFALSPDGTKVAYSSRTALRVVDLPSGVTRTVASLRDFAAVDFSPDGTQLVFARTARGATRLKPRSDLYVVPTRGGTPRRLTRTGLAAEPRWGARGIAFTNYRVVHGYWAGGQLVGDLRTIRADGTGLRKIARGRARAHIDVGYHPLGWSDDGSRLIATNSYAQELTGFAVQFGAAGVVRRSYTSKRTPLAISRDGQEILATRGAGAEVQPFGGAPARRLALSYAAYLTWNR